MGGAVASASGFMSEFIYSGMFDRFPGLRIVAAETGAGWIPNLLEHMDDHWWRNRTWTDSQLELLPSEYFRRNWLTTFIREPFAVAVRHWIGVDNMMWSTDYPHHRHDWPYSRRIIEESMGGVPEDEKRAMIRDNAARLYKLVYRSGPTRHSVRQASAPTRPPAAARSCGGDTRPWCRRAWSMGSGSTSRQTSITNGHRVWKRQPAGGSTGLGTSPRERDPLARTFDHGVGERHRGEQRLGVGVLRVVYTTSAWPCSTIRPRYITAMSSAHVADDRQVVRDEEVRDAESSLEPRIRLITWACVDTSSELTGSSHTTRPGLASARAIAARCSWPPENWYGYR